MIPTCLQCGKPLRKEYRIPPEVYNFKVGEDRKELGKRKRELRIHVGWGRYADNFFCGLTCGWRWAVKKAQAMDPDRAKLQGAEHDRWVASLTKEKTL